VATTPEHPARRAAELAARHSYGRIVAYLVRSWRNLAAVEDALGEAFARALETWPVTGVPAQPDAWLLVTARRRLTDAARSNAVRANAVRSLLVTTPDQPGEEAVVPDKRLELMFACAHPAIDPAIHAPLMLQAVLGLSAQHIASSFLVSPDAMSRRLSRAKQRIADIGLSFELPEPESLPGRITSVAEAIYAAYGQGWDSIASDDATRRGLSEEALWLARVLVHAAPADAEAHGLLALLLYCEARSDARRVDGQYIPFDAQDIERWDFAMIGAAEASLGTAGRLGAPGRFQLEAAIQSALVQSRRTAQDMRAPLLALHARLLDYAPTIGNFVAHAAVLAELEGPAAGLSALDRLPHDRAQNYQPWWAVRAHLLRQQDSNDPAADEALRRAIGLTEDPAVRTYLQRQLPTLQ
jgi:RNA polymerase sigma-70 factor (ECF subfamily)